VRHGIGSGLDEDPAVRVRLDFDSQLGVDGGVVAGSVAASVPVRNLDPGVPYRTGLHFSEGGDGALRRGQK
jgi:hypothetical protein